MEDVLQLYQKYRDDVYRLALACTKSAPEAEDICQTVFMRLVEHPCRIDSGRERAWLCKVAINLCRDWSRSAWRRKTAPLAEDIPADADFQDREQREVYEAVLSLRPKERLAVHLFYYVGYSTGEIAEITGVTQSAVTSRLERARRHLRQKLEGDYEV